VVTAVPAALGWRLLAMVYDLLPVLAIWFAVAALVLLLRGGLPVAPGSVGAWLELALMLIAGFGYFGLSWRRGGQTLGMRAWRLRVLRADGSAPGWRALMLRYLVAGASLAAGGLGFLWSLVDRQRRSWHDLASGTVLVRLPKNASASSAGGSTARTAASR
jgi:uncharacterized RDD family membrane protein YckC